MSGYRTLRFWSPAYGSYVVRLSMWNDRGHEYFVHIPDQGAKALRKAMHGTEDGSGGYDGSGALDRIMDAIARHDDPGEIKL